MRTTASAITDEERTDFDGQADLELIITTKQQIKVDGQ
jgi:hypothetical protein